MEKLVGTVTIDQFSGRVSNRSPHVGPEAFVEFDNLQSLTPGVMHPRKGMRPLVFSPTITPGTDDVIAMYSYRAPASETILWENSAGKLIVGFSPS